LTIVFIFVLSLFNSAVPLLNQAGANAGRLESAIAALTIPGAVKRRTLSDAEGCNVGAAHVEAGTDQSIVCPLSVELAANGRSNAGGCLKRGAGGGSIRLAHLLGVDAVQADRYSGHAESVAINDNGDALNP
jgi:hypothetical protein